MRLNRQTTICRTHVRTRAYLYLGARTSEVICRAACHCGVHSDKGCNEQDVASEQMPGSLLPRRPFLRHVHDLDGRALVRKHVQCQTIFIYIFIYLRQLTAFSWNVLFGCFHGNLLWQAARVFGRWRTAKPLNKSKDKLGQNGSGTVRIVWILFRCTMEGANRQAKPWSDWIYIRPQKVIEFHNAATVLQNKVSEVCRNT